MVVPVHISVEGNAEGVQSGTLTRGSYLWGTIDFGSAPRNSSCRPHPTAKPEWLTGISSTCIRNSQPVPASPGVRLRDGALS
jgi:hypothetical protein